MIRIREFFDPASHTLTYLVWKDRDALVIDPVLDYDLATEATSERALAQVTQTLERENLQLRAILETHAHADHLTGARALKRRFPKALYVVGERIREVQKAFQRILELPADFPTDGRQFDRLVKDDEILEFGALTLRVLTTPGHTPACVSYLVEDAVFTGDALFLPDSGVGRCDFPGGSADALYESITTKIYRLPDTTRVFTGHDYQPQGRALRFQSTIGEQQQSNIHLNAQTARSAFVRFRTERDATLCPPKLLQPSLRYNLTGESPVKD